MSSPFALSPADKKARRTPRLPVSPAVLLFFVGVLTGLVLIGWRAKNTSDCLRAHARSEALARATLIQTQFDHAIAVAEVLGALAKQSGGAIPNFQKVATDLLAAHPGLAWIESQPGGSVSEIVPRTGRERALGLKVIEHPVYRPGAAATLQRRALTIAGPVALYSGESGIIARVPIFQRGREGREVFWGFVAVSMRFKDVLSRAGLDEAWAQGFAYTLVLPLSGKQPPLAISRRGNVSLADISPQPIRAQNLELRLALKPRSGWFDPAIIALQALAVLILSAVGAFMLKICQSRHGLDAGLTNAEQRLTREIAERKKADEACLQARDALAAAQAQLKPARAELDTANTTVAQLQTRLDAVVRDSNQHTELAQAALKEAQAKCVELEQRLQAATRSQAEGARAKEQELQAAQEKFQNLQRRLEAEAGAGKKALAELQSKLNEKEIALAQLQARLDAAASSSDELLQAAQARLKAAEDKNLELNEQLARAEQGTGHSEVALVDRPSDAEPSDANGKNAVTHVDLAPEVTAAPASRIEKSPVAAPPQPAIKPTKPKRKRGSRNDQMDLFGAPPPSAPTPVPAPELALVSTPGAAVDLPLAEPDKVPAPPELEPEVSVSPAPVPEKVLPAALAEFASIAGLDCRDGLLRAEEDPKVYLKALRVFCQEQLELPEKIRDALVQAELPAAARLVQALKTAGEAIGATRVQTAAARLAETMHRHSDPAEIEFVWVDLEKSVTELGAELKPLLPPEPEKPVTRRLPPPPEVDSAELRSAVNAMFPLLVDGDPGAKDCLKDNRNTFRSAFSPEAYAEFEQLVKRSDFNSASEHLRKAARKHGINV